VNDYVILLLGIACAGAGGELFVRGTVGLAGLARISPGIVGATVAAFATSSPELSVAISSALAGTPEIALGDVLGSNINDVAVVLGLALLISGVQSPRDSIRRDMPAALSIPVLTGILFVDGELSRVDGLLMLCLFVVWFAATFRAAMKQRCQTEAIAPEASRIWLVVLSSMAGMAFLVAAGNLIVTGARAVALSFGIDEFTIGATVVAVGTTVPELATTIAAKLRGHDEVGLGTVLGSAIFNGLLIVSVTAIIHPITAPQRDVAVALAFGVAAVALAVPPRNGFIERKRGVLLLALYAAYLTTILHGGAVL
jgi:cation:H+ antiporter